MTDDLVARLREFNEERLNCEPWTCEQTAKEAADKIERLTAERDALRALLRPFAKAADNFDSSPIKDAEGWFAYSGQSSFNKVTGAITVGDLRRARAALNKGGGDE